MDIDARLAAFFRSTGDICPCQYHTQRRAAFAERYRQRLEERRRGEEALREIESWRVAMQPLRAVMQVNRLLPVGGDYLETAGHILAGLFRQDPGLIFKARELGWAHAKRKNDEAGKDHRKAGLHVTYNVTADTSGVSEAIEALDNLKSALGESLHQFFNEGLQATMSTIVGGCDPASGHIVWAKLNPDGSMTVLGEDRQVEVAWPTPDGYKCPFTSSAAYRAYAQKVGKTAADLTDVEKTQAYFEAVVPPFKVGDLVTPKVGASINAPHTPAVVISVAYSSWSGTWSIAVRWPSATFMRGKMYYAHDFELAVDKQRQDAFDASQGETDPGPSPGFEYTAKHAYHVGQIVEIVGSCEDGNLWPAQIGKITHCLSVTLKGEVCYLVEAPDIGAAVRLFPQGSLKPATSGETEPRRLNSTSDGGWDRRTTAADEPIANVPNIETESNLPHGEKDAPMGQLPDDELDEDDKAALAAGMIVGHGIDAGDPMTKLSAERLLILNVELAVNRFKAATSEKDAAEKELSNAVKSLAGKIVQTIDKAGKKQVGYICSNKPYIHDDMLAVQLSTGGQASAIAYANHIDIIG